MCDIKPIKTLIILENFLCIYRNVSFYNETAKKIILARVIIETCLYFGFTVSDMYNIYNYFSKNLSAYCLVVVYNIMFLCHSMLCIIEALRRSDIFKELLDSFEKMHKNLDKDVTYNKSIHVLNYKCILISVVYLVMMTANIFLEKLNFTFGDRYIVYDILLHYVRIFREYRYLMEYLVYSFLMMILHKIFNRFNLILLETQKKLINNIKLHENISDKIDLKIIEGWAKMYGDIVKSSRLFRKCFGRQIVFAIDMAIIYYVIVLYYMWNILLQGNRTIQGMRTDMVLINLTLSFAYHTVAIMIAIVAAQKVQNEIRMLRIYLASLYNTLTAYPNRLELKEIKNFFRLVSMNPVEINIVPGLGMGMPLLPACVSLAATYVIIMLQFNHVV